MKRAPKPWPVVITRLVDTVAAAAKEQGVRGVVRVYELEERGKRYFAVAAVVPASETVAARATRR